MQNHQKLEKLKTQTVNHIYMDLPTWQGLSGLQLCSPQYLLGLEGQSYFTTNKSAASARIASVPVECWHLSLSSWLLVWKLRLPHITVAGL